MVKDPKFAGLCAGIGEQTGEQEPIAAIIPYAVQAASIRPDINAFALPGGMCTSNRGFADLSELEAQMAATCWGMEIATYSTARGGAAKYCHEPPPELAKLISNRPTGFQPAGDLSHMLVTAMRLPRYGRGYGAASRWPGCRVSGPPQATGRFRSWMS